MGIFVPIQISGVVVVSFFVCVIFYEEFDFWEGLVVRLFWDVSFSNVLARDISNQKKKKKEKLKCPMMRAISPFWSNGLPW